MRFGVSGVGGKAVFACEGRCTGTTEARLTRGVRSLVSRDLWHMRESRGFRSLAGKMCSFSLPFKHSTPIRLVQVSSTGIMLDHLNDLL